MHAWCPAQLETFVHEVYQEILVHPAVIVHEPDLEHPSKMFKHILPLQIESNALTKAQNI